MSELNINPTFISSNNNNTINNDNYININDINDKIDQQMFIGLQKDEQLYKNNEIITYLKTSHGKTRYIINGNCNNSDHVIIFVCGISSHSFSFNYLMNNINNLINNNENISFLRYDKYGRGKSDNPNIEHTVDLFVEQLKELIDELILKNYLKENKNRPKITIIGFSMGGCISIHFSTKYSNLVDNLILFSPAGASWKLPFGNSIVQLPYLGNLIFSTIFYLTSEEQRMNSGFFNLKNEIVKERILYSIKMKIKENSQIYSQTSSFVNSLQNFPLQGCENEIEKLGKLNNIKILLIWSLFDITIPIRECFNTFYNYLKKNTKFVILNNTRHTFYMEREFDTSKIIVNFLKNENILDGIEKQEPNMEVMTRKDLLVWEYFNNHDEFKKIII